jgi:hypothetical protein
MLLAACNYAPNAGGIVASQGPFPSPVFAARYVHGAAYGTYLSLFDERSGKHSRDLVHLGAGAPAELGGFSRTTDGSVVYALIRGPAYTSNTEGGKPLPGTCGGTVYRIDADTGNARSLFTVAKDRTVTKPTVSPDGKMVAYLGRACGDASARSMVIHDLGSDRERSVSITRDAIGGIAWSPAGAALVLTVEDAGGPAGYLVLPVSASGPQPAAAVRSAPDTGCVVVAASYAAAGVQLVEGCPNRTTAPARLVQLAGAGPMVSWREDTGLCPNGLAAVRDPAGALVLSAPTQCGGTGAPVDVVQVWTGRTPREVARYANPDQSVSDAN